MNGYTRLLEDLVKDLRRYRTLWELRREIERLSRERALDDSKTPMLLKKQAD